MSVSEHIHEADPIGSRVKITMNAKREAQPEVSVREGTTEAELDRIVSLALAKYRELQRELAS